MATIPSGWAYYDASEHKRLLAGATMPTPAIDDEYFGVTSTGGIDYSKLIYHYNDARTLEYPYKNNTTPGMEIEFTIPAGWGVNNREYTMINADVLSNIAGANVVSVYISERASNLISINLPSTVVAVWIYNSTTLQTVTGTLTSVLKCFNCYGSTALISVPSLIQATNITNGIRMFKNCSSLTTVPALPPNIVSLYECFCNCTSLQSLPSIPSTVIDEGYMCLECTALQQAPINYSTVVKWIEGVFKNCTHLTNASNFTIPNSVVDMSAAFQGCTSLITPPSVIRGTNANAYRLFYDCTSLVTPPTFEGTYSKMDSLFYNCTLLETAPTIPHGTQTMNWAFGDCISLEEMPYIPSGIIALSHCFYNCVSLTRIDICLNSQLGSTFSYMFAGCTNLTGTIYLSGTDVATCDYMFDGITKTIIVCGHEAAVSYLVGQQNNSNVYQEISPTYDNISAVRTDNTGTLDDTGEYMQLSINFTCPVMDHSKIYVPKIYTKNNQIEPYQNWTLTYTNEGTEVVKIIPNSTDISSARIEANDIIEQGNFTTLFSAEDLFEGVALQIFIPTSNSQIAIDWDDTNDQYVISTVYWSGTRGSAIFTGETYIFDATPDGNSFKIGGPIQEDEEGFIVGNRGLPLLADQYSSTFNGPVTMASIIDLELPNYQIADTTDKKLYDIIRALGWSSDVLSQ